MPLYPQQLAAVAKYRKVPRAINLSPYGTGKTRTVVARLAEICPPKRALCVVPGSKVEDWYTELTQHGNRDWRVALLGGPTARTRRQRLRAFRRPHHVAVINHDGVAVMGKMLLGYDVLAVDELHDFKNPYAVTSRALAALSENMASVIGLTGNPVTENLTDLYSVFRIVNPQMVDAEFIPWLQRYFVYESRPDELGRRQYPKWHPKDGAKETLAAALHAISYYCPRESLPVEWPSEIDAADVMVDLDPSSRRAYDALDKECRLALRDVDISVDNVRSKLTKLLQLASGWVYNDQSRPVWVGRASKLEALARHVEEVRREGQILIWAMYPLEIRFIGAKLRAMGVSHALCHGKVKAAERERAKAAFNDGSIQAIVANPTIWGPGVDLYAHFATTFSRNWSGDLHGQKRGRPLRSNSVQKGVDRVVFTEFVARDTADAGCLKSLRLKRDLIAEIIRLRYVPRG